MNNNNELQDLVSDTQKLLENCNSVLREMDEMKRGVDFLINDYKTNKTYFCCCKDYNKPTIEDIIKTKLKYFQDLKQKIKEYKSLLG